MQTYVYSAEALNPQMVKSYEGLTGYVHGFVQARSQLEAIHAAISAIVDHVRMCYDWDPREMRIERNETTGAVTIIERDSDKIINHIQHFAVHEC